MAMAEMLVEMDDGTKLSLEELSKRDTIAWRTQSIRFTDSEKPDIFEQAQNRDPVSLEKVIGAYYLMIVNAAKKITPDHLPITDSINTGVEGFLHATVDNLDVQQVRDGTDPTRFLRRHVSSAIWDCIAEVGFPIKITRNDLDKYLDLRDVEEDFVTHHGRRPSIKEL